MWLTGLLCDKMAGWLVNWLWLPELACGDLETAGWQWEDNRREHTKCKALISRCWWYILSLSLSLEREREREKENDALLLFFYCVRATTRDVYLISVSSSTRLYINTWGEENHPCVCTQYNHKVHQITECEIWNIAIAVWKEHGEGDTAHMLAPLLDNGDLGGTHHSIQRKGIQHRAWACRKMVRGLRFLYILYSYYIHKECHENMYVFFLLIVYLSYIDTVLCNWCYSVSLKVNAGQEQPGMGPSS